MTGSKFKQKVSELHQDVGFLNSMDPFFGIQFNKMFFKLFECSPNVSIYNYDKIDYNKIVEVSTQIIKNNDDNEYFHYITYDESNLPKCNSINSIIKVSDCSYYSPNSSDPNETNKEFIFYTNNAIINFNNRCLRIFYKYENDLKNVVSMFDGLFDYIQNIPKDTPTFKLVCQHSNGYYTSSFEAKKIELNLDETYNDDLKQVDEDITKFLESDGSGLIILHGLQGTGKTTYIKHLMSKTNKSVLYMSSNLIANLDSPNFVAFLSDQKNSIIIAEDSEELLKARCSGSGVNNGIVNILNLSDGILGDALKIKFICTFNAELSVVDKALQRKGRLKARYEFKELKADKVSKLNNKYNLGILEEDIKDMSLADIFNYDNSDFSVKTNKIGLCK